MSAEEDRRYLALAIALGARGLGRVWPNPAVGCVIVKEGRIVDEFQRGKWSAEQIVGAATGAAKEAA